MSNLLKNSLMRDWRHVRHFWNEEGKTGTIEAPANWDFLAVSLNEDPNTLPESLHRDDGFVISGAYIRWKGGFKQGNIPLKAGQSYRAFVRFKPDVNFAHNQPLDLTAITWRFAIESDLGTLEQDWVATQQGQYKQIETHTFDFDVAQDTTAALTFWTRSFYAGNDCDLWVYEITLEPIPQDGSAVPILGTPTEAIPNPPPEPVPVEEEPDVLVTEKIPRSDVESIVGPSGKSLGDVLTVAQIDTIAKGLRTLAVNAPDSDSTLGLNTLADAIERLK